jgi:hypothetical protein
MNQNLATTARQLRLSGLLNSLELRLEETRTHQLPHEQFLELIFQDELNVRQQRMIDKRTKAAGFRDQKTLEDFDWTFNPAIKRQQMYDLATGQFIRQRRDVLMIGPPGLGKSHLVQAIGYHLIKAGFQVVYTSIFDLVRQLTGRSVSRRVGPHHGPLSQARSAANRRHGSQNPPRQSRRGFPGDHHATLNRSTFMTSNRPIEEWYGVCIVLVPIPQSTK